MIRKRFISGSFYVSSTLVETRRPYCEAQRSRVPNPAYFTGRYKAAIEQAEIYDDCVTDLIIEQPTILLNKTGENQFDVVKGLFDYKTIKAQPGTSIHCVYGDTTEETFTHFMILSQAQFRSLNCSDQNCVTGVQYGQEGWTVRGTANKRQRENDDEAGRAAQRQRTSLSSRMSTLTLKF